MGHLVTTALACGASYAASRSLVLAAGVALGGFLIDLDHYFDYLVFERQYSLDPFRFVRYYENSECQRTILFLHSYELMALLALIALLTGSRLLAGYLLGATMHLVLDVIFNGQHALRRPVHFYSFLYRRRHGFLASHLLNTPGAGRRD
jgi:hypothetical protein